MDKEKKGFEAKCGLGNSDPDVVKFKIEDDSDFSMARDKDGKIIDNTEIAFAWLDEGEKRMTEEIFMCTTCGFKISQKEAEEKELGGCPNCNATGVPCTNLNDIELKINWHELACLVMWAERWAISSQERSEKTEDVMMKSQPFVQVVYGIADRIAQQYPERQERSPLTLMGQLSELRDYIEKEGGTMQTTFPGIEGASIDLKENEGGESKD